MLAKGLLVDRSQLDGVNDLLVDRGARLLAQQLCQIALLPASVRAVDGAILAHAQEQRVDDNLRAETRGINDNNAK